MLYTSSKEISFMSINLEPEVKQKLEALSALTGTSQTELVNVMLRRALSQLTDGLQQRAASGPRAGEASPPGSSLADQIRRWVIDEVFEPARQRGLGKVIVMAGVVHKKMGLRNRLPAVCAALGSDLLVQRASVKRISVDGPSNGARTAFTFELSATVPQ
jgi:hypothetical protein